MHMSLNKLWETVKVEASMLQLMGSQRTGHESVTEQQDPHQVKTAVLKHIDPRVLGIGRLITDCPERPFCYLISNQSENCPQVYHASYSFSSNMVFKSPFPKTNKVRNFQALGTPFLALCLAINVALSFTTIPCQ